MKRSERKDQGEKKITEAKIFSVPFDLEEINENITITTNTPSKEEIISN